MKLPKLSTIWAGIICALALRILAVIAAQASIGSWWLALLAVAVLDSIEALGNREVDRWRAPKI